MYIYISVYIPVDIRVYLLFLGITAYIMSIQDTFRAILKLV